VIDPRTDAKPLILRNLLHEADVAELAACAGGCDIRRFATVDAVFGRHLEVRAELVRELFTPSRTNPG
jgi:hypothetical protein